jgi:hypothetical protein
MPFYDKILQRLRSGTPSLSISYDAILGRLREGTINSPVIFDPILSRLRFNDGFYYLGELKVGTGGWNVFGWSEDNEYGSIQPEPLMIGDTQITEISWADHAGTLRILVVANDYTNIKYIYIGDQKFEINPNTGEADCDDNPFPAEGETIKIGINRRPIIYPNGILSEEGDFILVTEEEDFYLTQV